MPDFGEMADKAKDFAGDHDKQSDEALDKAADFVGEGELSAWFGGSAKVIVVYLDTRAGEAVEVDRVIPRDA